MGNDDKKMKNSLLKLLRDDDEVRCEIKKIFIKTSCDQDIPVVSHSADEAERLRGEYANLMSEYKKLHQQYKKLDEKFAEKTREAENYRNNWKNAETKQSEFIKELSRVQADFDNLQGEKTRLYNDYQSLTAQYCSLDDMYHKYLNLGSGIHKKLQRVLNSSEQACDSAELFLGFGVQEGNLVALWDTIATNAENFEREDVLGEVVDIFNYLFELHRAISYKEINTIIPQVGDGYDERYHTRTTESNAVGEIARVVLPGFTIGKNINRKALVYVR